jgi:hypothetical protein
MALSDRTQFRESVLTRSAQEIDQAPGRRTFAVSWSALGFAIVEGGCIFLVSVNSIAALLGAGTLLAAGGGSVLHSDVLRIPALALATIGALLNLFVLWRRWTLAGRLISQRRKRDRRRTLWTLTASVLTLLIVAGEVLTHPWVHLP